MKAIVDAKSLSAAIAWVTKHYDLKKEKNFVELYVNANGEGYLSHQSTNAFLRAPFKINSCEFATDDNEVKLPIDGRYLKSLGSAIEMSDNIQMSKNSNKTTVITVAAKSVGKFSIPIVSAVETKKQPKWTTFGFIDDQEFLSTLNRVAKICENRKDNIVDFTSIVKIMPDVKNKTLCLLATDRYTMASVKLNYEPEDTEENKLIIDSLGNNGILFPREAATSVMPTKGVSAPVVLITEKLAGSNIRFGYEFPDGRVFLHSLVASNYPDVDKVLNHTKENVNQSMFLDTGATVTAMGRLGQLVWDEDKHYFTFNAKSAHIGNSNGSTVLSIPTKEHKMDEQKITIAFMRSIISSAISVINTSMVKVMWSESSKNGRTVLLHPVLDDGSEITATTVVAAVSS